LRTSPSTCRKPSPALTGRGGEHSREPFGSAAAAPTSVTSILVSDPGASLDDQYRRRFEAEDETRRRVWRALIDAWFRRYLVDAHNVLDLGCGWGPFINQIDVAERYGIDLNPDAANHLDDRVTLFEQAADDRWPLDDHTLDLVFSSNFLEHLPDRDAVRATLAEAFRCLRPGGRLVLMGPNIKYVGGAYWDFFDHYVPLTEASLVEATELVGFRTETVYGRFLPFTMAGKPPPPSLFVKAYLRFRPAWRVMGKQFLVVVTKP
jgi:SAM-dependent methyltransferase